MLLSHQPTTTFSYYAAAEYGAHGVTVELGKVCPFGENDLTRFTAIQQTLTQLISQGVFAQFDIEAMQFFAVQDALVKDHDDYKLLSVLLR